MIDAKLRIENSKSSASIERLKNQLNLAKSEIISLKAFQDSKMLDLQNKLQQKEAQMSEYSKRISVDLQRLQANLERKHKKLEKVQDAFEKEKAQAVHWKQQYEAKNKETKV
ncbi:unnamed protein product [Protopolystoma xenopodis]|uniref:Uncharacterized protein n=1 Tax=Protopolystoma xenopodis TaxID=117903 RepID=A0A448WB36_9PLAT|nr:unnamed protein product [Protopolystoma xenopodis]